MHKVKCTTNFWLVTEISLDDGKFHASAQHMFATSQFVINTNTVMLHDSVEKIIIGRSQSCKLANRSQSYCSAEFKEDIYTYKG